MRQIAIALFASLFLSAFAFAENDNGLVRLKSAHDVKTTADQLESMLKKKGITVFARIDHGQGAKEVGETLRPTELLIFGNPKMGAPLMNCGQSVGIDLPLKALIWEDENGEVWLAYNHPDYFAKRHGIKGCQAVLEKMEKALANFAKGATAKPKSGMAHDRKSAF